MPEEYTTLMEYSILILWSYENKVFKEFDIVQIDAADWRCCSKSQKQRCMEFAGSTCDRFGLSRRVTANQSNHRIMDWNPAEQESLQLQIESWIMNDAEYLIFEMKRGWNLFALKLCGVSITSIPSVRPNFHTRNSPLSFIDFSLGAFFMNDNSCNSFGYTYGCIYTQSCGGDCCFQSQSAFLDGFPELFTNH